MNFDILLQKDVTLDDVKTSDAVKFIDELGLEGEAKNNALSNYFNKSILALAKSQGNFVLGEEMVLYLENNNTIVVRKQFENKLAKLVLDLENSISTMSIEMNGAEKNKSFEGTTKIVDIIKTFNTVIKSLTK